MSDTEKRITAKYILDSTGFNSSMKGINAQLKENQSALKLAGTQVDAFGRQNKDLKAVQEELSKRIELQSKKVDLYKQSIEKSTEKMNANIKTRDKLKNELDQEKEKYESAIKVYGKESEVAQRSKEKVEQLTEEHKKAEKAVETNAKSIQGYETNLNKANAEIAKSQGQLNKVNKELSNNNNKWLAASKTLKEHSEKLGNVGKKINSAGDALLKLNAPLVGVGIAAAKVGMDFDSQMSRVQAISGATGEDFEKLKNQAIDLGASTAFSALECAQGMENLASAGFNTQETMKAMPGMLDLAASSGEDLATSSDIAASSLRGFGLEASQASHVADVFAKNSADTNAAVADTGEAMKYCAPVAHAFGLSLEECTASIGIMANAGIKGSEAGTTLRGALTRLAKPSDAAATAMEKMGFSAFDSHGKMVQLNEMIKRLQKSTKGMTDEQKQSTLATIFGQEALSGMLALIDAGPNQLNDLTNGLKNCNGAASNMAKTMQDNAKSSIEQMFGSLETAGIKLEEGFAPVITQVANAVGNLADKFSALSPETQQSIVKFVGLGIAAGGALKIVGGGISTIGTIAGGLSKLTGFLGLGTAATTAAGTAATVAGTAATGASVGIGAMTAAALPWIAAAGLVAVAGYGIYKAFTTEATPAVDLFADKIEETKTKVQDSNGTVQEVTKQTTFKISEETKKQVGAYEELNTKATKHLQDLYVNSTNITSTQCKQITDDFTAMAKSINESIESNKKKEIDSLKGLFADAQGIQKDEQKKILDKVNQSYADRESANNKHNERIKKIMETASKEHRELTKAEKDRINEIQADMEKQAIKEKSQGEKEATVIMERLKANTEKITADQASVEIKNANNACKKTVDEANKKYDEQIATITRERDEAGSISKEQADKMIAEAKRQRDETVRHAEDMKEQTKQKIGSMCDDIYQKVDRNTGDTLSLWKKLKNWWNGWKPDTKEFRATVETSERVSKQGSGRMLSNEAVFHNATGTSSFVGGLTTLHENGYELYDLPSKTRIYNHEASENLVKQTAADVAKSVLNGTKSNGEKTTIKNVTIPIYLGGNKLDEYIYDVASNKIAMAGRRIR